MPTKKPFTNPYRSRISELKNKLFLICQRGQAEARREEVYRIKNEIESLKRREREVEKQTGKRSADNRHEQGSSKHEQGSSKDEQGSYREQQGEQEQVVQDLNNIRVSCSCKAIYKRGIVEVAFGPQASIEKGTEPRIQFGIDVNINRSSTNRDSGIQTLVSAKKNCVELGVEATVSSTGTEYGYTGKVHGLSDFNAGVEVWSDSFKELLHPITAVNNGQLFFGGTFKGGTNVRLGVLPVEKLKSFSSCHADEDCLDLSGFCTEEQNQVGSDNIDPVSEQKEAQQEPNPHQEDLNLEDEKEATKQSEKAENLNHQVKETSTFAEARAFRQANQVAISHPPQLPPGCGHTRPFLFDHLAVKLLALGGLWGFLTLVYKFKTRNKD